mgnify:CR=1 FL=1
MSVRGFTVVATLLALAFAPQVSVIAQGTFDPPRAPDGKPDLQGVWDFRTLTPLQRPEDQEKAVLTAEEAAELESQEVTRAEAAFAPSEVRNEPLPVGGNVGAYNSYWSDVGAGVVDDQRTSLIIDPPSGRVPPLKAGYEMVELSLSEDRSGARPVRVRAAGIGADSYEDRGLAERCLLGFNSGPPIVPAGYNQNVQIFQTAAHVVILHEMVHDARIVPLDGRAHIDLGQWTGDSRGYWEGDTLVVETRSFLRETSFQSGFTDSNLRLTERFTRVSPETLMYEAVIEDPTVWSSVWTYQVPMQWNDQPLFEYACHEGNYGLYNILAGARAEEAEAASSEGSR